MKISVDSPNVKSPRLYTYDEMLKTAGLYKAYCRVSDRSLLSGDDITARWISVGGGAQNAIFIRPEGCGFISINNKWSNHLFIRLSETISFTFEET